MSSPETPLCATDSELSRLSPSRREAIRLYGVFVGLVHSSPLLGGWIRPLRSCSLGVGQFLPLSAVRVLVHRGPARMTGIEVSSVGQVGAGAWAVALIVAACAAGASELPPEITVDRLLVRAEWQAEEGEHGADDSRCRWSASLQPEQTSTQDIGTPREMRVQRGWGAAPLFWPQARIEFAIRFGERFAVGS